MRGKWEGKLTRSVAYALSFMENIEHRQYLEGLPDVVQQGHFTLVHGTLRWPIWEYLYSVDAALAHFERQETPYSLVGHTHEPMVVLEDRDAEQGCRGLYLEDAAVVNLGDQRLVNHAHFGVCPIRLNAGQDQVDARIFDEQLDCRLILGRGR